jgi:hypothetical protein
MIPNAEPHPDDLPKPNALYTVPKGYLSTHGLLQDGYIRILKPLILHSFCWDIDGTVASVESGLKYVRSGSVMRRGSYASTYRVVVRTNLGWSAWGTVGNPEKGDSPLKVGDTVRLKSFRPQAFEKERGQYSTVMYRNQYGTKLSGVLTKQNRPPYYRLPLFDAVPNRTVELQVRMDKVEWYETIQWDKSKKQWTLCQGGKWVPLAPNAPQLIDR